jgi:bifunctional non-homologous end joining protein LigD
MSEPDPLRRYKEKRDFTGTPEPSPEIEERDGDPIFVVQKHDASNLHYDLRIESGGVLKSWAVPKGPSMDPKVRRLAVPTEDHPMAYADFEGVIPEGHYGAGTVIVWDRGTYRNTKGEDASTEKNLEEGHATLWLEGEKLKGGFAFIRTGGGDKPRWLFFKMKGDEARPGSDVTEEMPDSVVTGRSLEEVEQEEPAELSDFS